MLEQDMDTDTDHVVFGSTVLYYARTYIVFVIVMLMVMCGSQPVFLFGSVRRLELPCFSRGEVARDALFVCFL